MAGGGRTHNLHARLLEFLGETVLVRGIDREGDVVQALLRAAHDHRFVLWPPGTAQPEPVGLRMHVKTECGIELRGHVQVRHFQSEAGKADHFWRVHPYPPPSSSELQSR